jgi:hypothetical protein
VVEVDRIETGTTPLMSLKEAGVHETKVLHAVAHGLPKG